MSTECRLVLAGILLFAGCASAPQAPVESPAVPAASASAPAQASAVANASETEGVAGDTASAATAEAVQTVEVAKLADTNPVTCRDILIQGSNVLRKQCMTRNDWKTWNRAQELWAQDMVLRMQHMKR
jgi:uncharacterized lipoprotein YajG